MSTETDLNDVLETIFVLLDEAATDRKSPMHAPAVASNGLDNGPNQRIMVLRDFDLDNVVLRFHTDYRSPKVAEISAHSAISILTYHPEKRIQLKLYGQAKIHNEGDQVTEAWIQTDMMGRRVYLCEPGSGSKSPISSSGLATDLQQRRPTIEESEKGRKNFAIMLVEIHRIDWMYLNSKGNRAASFQKADNGWSGHWLIP